MTIQVKWLKDGDIPSLMTVLLRDEADVPL